MTFDVWEEIKNGWPWHGDLEGKSMPEAVLAELHDYQMIIRHCTEIYMEASGGQISKPNTLPSEVIGLLNERIEQAVRDAAPCAMCGLRHEDHEHEGHEFVEFNLDYVEAN